MTVRPLSGRNHADLNLLRTFVALIEERSTVRAGRRLFLSQSTVAGALSRLREAFGDELLVRNGRALEPTARALELLDAIRPHLDGLAASLTAVSPFLPASDRRVFRLGCTDAVAVSALPRLTASLRRDAPGCDLVVRIGDYRGFPEMLAAAEVSTVLGYLRDDPPATARVRVLRQSPWVLVRDPATPPVADLDDFCTRAHALVTPMGDLAGFVDESLVKQGRQRRVALGVANFLSLLAVVPGSDLVATVPDFVAYGLASLGDLAVEPCPVAIPPVTNTLAWRAATDRDPAERWFRQKVTEAFAAASPA
jgi:LysR family transcriptional regulator, mexEF-oprN operon transcriptional activator